MIRVECPDCSKSYNIADELAGKTAKCRDCGGRIPIPQLRTNREATAEQTRLPQPKPAQTKSQSPKATAAPPTNSKPSTKPKPAPKKPQDDFIEDDLEEITEFDDLEEVDDFEPMPIHRASGGKRKMKRAGAGLGRFSKRLTSVAVLVKSKTSPLLMALLFCFIVGAAGVLHPAIAASSMLICVVCGGLTMAIASLRMVVVTFRIDTGWAIFFLIGGLIDMGLTAIGLGLIGALVSFFGFLVSIRLLVENWSEYRGPIHLALAGFVLIIAGPIATFLGMAGAGGVAQQGGATPPANTTPSSSPIAAPPLSLPASEVSFAVASVRVPEFEPLPALRPIAGNRMYGQSATKPGTEPGTRMQFAYYEPIGAHPPKSLPCVIMANSGTVLVSGIDVPSPNKDPETARYIGAGFSVLGISLDGKFPDSPNPTLEQLRLAFSQFRDAQAGLVNVRNGVEFLIQKVPQVDPNRLFVAGHSSAGTLALLAAAYEPRLKGCVAYCPASDSTALMMKPFLNDARAEIVYPGITRFAKQVSPMTHVARMSCPIFLFHAADDQTISVNDSRRFEQLLKSNRKQITYIEVPTGKDDVAVIQQGIPHAISWLKQLAGMSAASTAPSVQIASTNSATPKGVELPTFPNIAPPNIAPPNVGTPAGVLQPSGRVVTFRFSTFSGKGDPAAAARQALRNVSWADPNDIVIDQATSEIRIGQLGGSVNSEPARQALLGAGFQLIGGISIGAKKPASSTIPEPARPANSEPATPATSTPTVETPTTTTPPTKAASKPATPALTEPTAPKESGQPRRVVTFRYERYSGKGSSKNAAADALKKIKWADLDDIEVDTAKHEIRVGQLEESKEYGPAEKSLRDAGFSLSPGVTSTLRKR